MCRWLAYLGDTKPVDQFLIQPHFSLINQSMHARKGITQVNGDGFGLGWFHQRPTPGLFCDTGPAWNNANLHRLAEQIDAHCAMAHVRAATDTSISQNNCHPFLHEGWLMMHNGQISPYPKLRRQLEHMLDDEHYAARHGDTDSELLFLLWSQLGGRDKPMDAWRDVVRTITSAAHLQHVQAEITLSVALSDGETLFALRYAHHKPPPTVYYHQEDDGILVVSEPIDGDHWRALPPDHCLRYHRGSLEIQRFDAL